MAWTADLTTFEYTGTGNDGPRVLAIGWLEHDHPFPTGLVAPQYVQRLQELLALTDSYQLHYFLGFHTCTLCPPHVSRNLRPTGMLAPDGCISNQLLWVPAPDALYGTNGAIVHYILDHGYQPPQAFLDAVLACPDPGSDAYFDLFVQQLFPERRHLVANMRIRRAKQQAAAMEKSSGIESGKLLSQGHPVDR